jgi:hypothetical protein
MAGKPSKETKMVMWDPGRGFTDPEQYFEWHKMKFFNKCVQPVSDEVFEALRHSHNFHIIYARKYNILDFNDPTGKNKIIKEPEALPFETENSMVQ